MRLVCHCRKHEGRHEDVIIESFVDWRASLGPLRVVAHTPWSWKEFVEVAFLTEHPFAKVVCVPTIWRSVLLRATSLVLARSLSGSSPEEEKPGLRGILRRGMTTDMSSSSRPWKRTYSVPISS